MDERMKFMVCCTEMFRSRHAMTGEQVMDLFGTYGVMDYLDTFYEALHVMGNEYIMEDLEELIDERRNAVGPDVTVGTQSSRILRNQP